MGEPLVKRIFSGGMPYLIRALTPLHPGSGARVSGLVDLPVQREAHTDLPVIYGSSLKGALRAWASKKLEDGKVLEIFGPKPGEGDKGMGKAVFMDAKLLMIPVRSLKGVYGWVTSPFLINRFIEDLNLVDELLGRGKSGQLEGVQDPGKGEAFVSGERLTLELRGKSLVILEDVKYKAVNKEMEFLKLMGGKLKEVGERLVVVSDDEFRRLLKRALMVNPHIQIDEEKGVVNNLWFQEDLPPETIMYSAVFFPKELEQDLRKVLSGVVHVGGDMTTGLGFAEIIPLR